MMEGERFTSFTFSYLETDLWIGVDPASYHNDISSFALERTRELRTILNEHIRQYPAFLTSLVPVPQVNHAHPVVKKMTEVSAIAGIGPMSAVAGAFAEYIGEAIIAKFGVKEIVVENGGDIFLFVQNDIEISVYAGNSPFSNKIAIVIPALHTPLGLCTSSGTIGHSLSFGKTDATVIACKDAALADTFATRFGNEVKTPENIPAAIALAESFPEIISILIIAGDQIGIKGQFKIKPLII